MTASLPKPCKQSVTDGPWVSNDVSLAHNMLHTDIPHPENETIRLCSRPSPFYKIRFRLVNNIS